MTRASALDAAARSSGPLASAVHHPSRAKAELGWRPVLDLDATLDWTADWYRAHAEGEAMRERTLAQIAAYEELL